MEGSCSCLDAPGGGGDPTPAAAAFRDILVKMFGSGISSNNSGGRLMVNPVLPTPNHGGGLGGGAVLP